MAFSDPIADFLTRIRNALKAQHRYVDIDWSKMKQTLAEILKDQGLIENCLFQVDEKQRGTIRIFLKYAGNRQPVIQSLRRVSKPGLRIYVNHQEIPSFHGNMGLAIVSTSQGVMPGSIAKKKRTGGELLCVIC
jgi:small subunit ribosomal protein S8